MSFDGFSKVAHMQAQVPQFRSYEKKGFGTPSDRSSSTRRTRGAPFDPLPYYPRLPNRPPSTRTVFTGVREDSFFQTGQRQVEVLRKRRSALFLRPDDAARDGFVDGDWAVLETETGEFKR